MAWVKVQFKNENIFTHAFSFVLCTKLVTSICKVNKAAVRPVFYRKPLKFAILYLSKFVDSIRVAVGELMGSMVEKGKYYLKDHYNLLNDLFGIERPEFDGMENDDVLNKPIGTMLTITSIFFIIVIAYIFIKY